MRTTTRGRGAGRRVTTAGLVLVLALSFAGGRLARADDTAEDAARAVAVAFEAADDARLAELAARTKPDAWLVVDVLLLRGQVAAARAFAGRTEDGTRAFLLAYVESPAANSVPPSAREALARAAAAHAARDGQAAVAALAGTHDLAPSVVAVRIAELRARALASIPQRRQSELVSRAAADLAGGLGWWGAAMRSLNRAGMEAYRRGAIDSAMEHWTDRLALEEAHGTPVGTAQTLGNLGVLYRMRGELDQALEVQTRALAVFEREEMPLGAARTVGNLGRIHEDAGDLRRALAAFLDATARMEQLGDRAGIAINIHNAGTAHLRLGDYANASRALERAVRIDRERGDEHAVAQDLLSLAVLNNDLGRQEEAFAVYEQVLEIARRQQDPRLEASALRSIGTHFQRRGEAERARKILLQAKAIHLRLGQVSDVAFVTMNLAAIEFRIGDPMQAVALYRKALDMEQARGGGLHTCAILTNMARVQVAIGDLDGASRSAERALEIARATGRLEEEAQAWTVMASLHAQTGRFAEAIDAARNAAKDVAQLARGLSEDQGTSVREGLAGVFEIGLAASHVRIDTDAAAFFLEAGRAGLLLESLSAGDALRTAVLPEALRRAEDDARRREGLAAKRLREARSSHGLRAVREARKVLDAKREALTEVRARLRREAKAAASLLDPQPDGLETIQGRLREGEAFVLYGAMSTTYTALLVTNDAARLVDLGPTETVAAASAALHYERPGDPAPPDAVDRLRALVVDPLRLDEDVTRVLLSPAGALTFVPFAMLFDDVELAYVPSASVYGLLVAGRGDAGEGVLALGDPDYGSVDGRRLAALRAGEKLLPLPATRDEVRAIGTVVLVGAEATEGRFRKELAKRARWRAVHFACHGLVRSDRPLLSSLAITPSSEDDGFLTALDVFQLSVPADLVVLSACETARGRVVEGEGLVGLVSAFFHAGAPRVLASLWSVDDKATSALMTRFYELWNPGRGKEGLGAADALRKAQAWVASHEKWKHPHYWAAWALWGLPD